MAPPRCRLEIRAPLLREDLQGLYARTCAQLGQRGGRELEVDVSAIAPDAVAVDAISRLELAARRHGCHVTLTGASVHLRQLIDLVGLSDVLFSPAGEGARRGGRSSRYPERT